MPLHRFRLRTLMIAVAVVGLLLGGALKVVRLGQDAVKYRALAVSYGQFAQEARQIRDTGRALGHSRRILRGSDLDPWIACYVAFQRKYERAARYPWLPLPANPPVPE